MSKEAEILQTPIDRHDTAKLEALKALAGAIAHDYNNLLTGILGNLELLQRRAAKLAVSGLDDYVNGARGAANRAVRLNQKLAAIAGYQSLNITAVPVAAIMDELTPEITRLLNADCSFRLLQEEALWNAAGDENALLDAILELVANACEAMPKGGSLTIATGNITIESHPEIRPGDYVMIEVRDTGPGMGPEIASRALEPFFSTRQSGAVKGLGLAAVDVFIRRCAGRIEIGCPPTGGASITLYLPRSLG